MIAALVVVSAVLFILAVYGWIVCEKRNGRIVRLREEVARLSAKADGLLLLKTNLKIVAHGKGGEQVVIEASRQAARTDRPWNVRISGEGGKDSVRETGEFQDIAVRLIQGVATVIFQVGRMANPKIDYRYPGLESYVIYTR